MPNSKTIKKICMEAFQLCAFATPIFVTGQRLATKECVDGCPPVDDSTTYWLFISAIIAYVTGITLLIWIPAKLLITWKKVYRPYEGLWFPGNVLYIIFAYIPCVALVLAGHEVCVRQPDMCFDYFKGAPLETLIIMMVVTDWSEKIRYIKLRSTDDTVRTKKYPYADYDGRKRSEGRGYSSSSVDEAIATVSRRSSLSHRSLLYERRGGSLRQRIARNLKWKDARPENLLRDLMLAYDTRLILGLSILPAGVDTEIFQTSWIYAIYILSALSLIPLVFSQNSAIRSSMTVIFQDVPFFILRISIYCTFGSTLVLETSTLFLLKNFFAAFAFIYFNLVLPWRVAKHKHQQYDLEQVNPGNGTVDGTGAKHFTNRMAAASTYETRNGHAGHHHAEGIANPGYTSRRYDEDERRNHHYQTREPMETHYDEREYFDDEGPDDDELYPIPQRMTHSHPQEARLERTSSQEYPEYHYQPESPVAVARHDQNRQSRTAPSPPPQTDSRPKEINYDTLNDPTSFLYSRGNNKKLERRSTKTKIVDIDFESAPSQPQDPLSPAPSSKPPVPAKPAIINSQPSDGHVISTPGPTTAANTQPTYATVDHSRRDTRRKAPPPPTSQSKETKDALPPPPPSLLEENQSNEGDPSGHQAPNITRGDSMYTPSLARQLAREATSRKTRKEEEEVLDALDEAVQHGKQMMSSRSTTPKSTISGPAVSGVAANDEEYDNRL